MIVVTGATGKVGSEVVRQLAAAGERVRAFVRDPARAVSLGDRVEVARGDLGDAASVERAMQGADRAFLAVNSEARAVAWMKGAISAAERAGVRHVVRLSAMGASHDGPGALLRWHAEIEDALRGSKMTWTILRPGFFTQNFLGSAETIRTQGAFHGAYGDGGISPIDTRDIAAVAVKCLREPGHEGKTYELTGSESLTQGEMAARVSAILGRTIRYVDLSVEDFQRGLVAAGWPEPLARDFAMFCGWVKAQGKPAPVLATGADLLGRLRTFDEFVRDHASGFAPLPPTP
jgi:uncharacterized protein YbjT (DUF2867 family)